MVRIHDHGGERFALFARGLVFANGLRAILHGGGVVAEMFEDRGEQCADAGLVVHGENSTGAGTAELKGSIRFGGRGWCTRRRKVKVKNAAFAEF